MIHWRTDVENAPRDGTPFLVPNPFPPRNGVESGVYLNKWCPEVGKAPARFGVEFSHWSEINLPSESVRERVIGCDSDEGSVP